MIHSRKRHLLQVVLTGAVLAAASTWSLRPGRAGFRTPAECLEVYRDACRTGDAASYRRCLGEPLLSQVRRVFPTDETLAESLRRDRREVKGWVEIVRPDELGGRTVSSVEEVRESGQRRLRFFFEDLHDGWLIVRVEKGAEQTPDIRYGTHVGEEEKHW
jgi:hypothetical protein